VLQAYHISAWRGIFQIITTVTRQSNGAARGPCGPPHTTGHSGLRSPLPQQQREGVCPAARGREEFEEMFDKAMRRFLPEVVAGRKRLRIDEITRKLAPQRRILGRRRCPRSPQYQQGMPCLAVTINSCKLSDGRLACGAEGPVIA
jgi:hypothetical protein